MSFVGNAEPVADSDSERAAELHLIAQLGAVADPATSVRRPDARAGGPPPRSWSGWDRTRCSSAGVVGHVVGAKPMRSKRTERLRTGRSATRATISALAPQLVQALSTTSRRPVCSADADDGVGVERASARSDRSPRP